METTDGRWTNGMAWPRPRVALCVRERHRETGAAIFGRNVMTRMLMMMSRRQRHLFIGISASLGWSLNLFIFLKIFLFKKKKLISTCTWWFVRVWTGQVPPGGLVRHQVPPVGLDDLNMILKKNKKNDSRPMWRVSSERLRFSSEKNDERARACRSRSALWRRDCSLLLLVSCFSFRARAASFCQRLFIWTATAGWEEAGGRARVIRRRPMTFSPSRRSKKKQIFFFFSRSRKKYSSNIRRLDALDTRGGAT